MLLYADMMWCDWQMIVAWCLVRGLPWIKWVQFHWPSLSRSHKFGFMLLGQQWWWWCWCWWWWWWWWWWWLWWQWWEWVFFERVSKLSHILWLLWSFAWSPCPVSSKQIVSAPSHLVSAVGERACEWWISSWWLPLASSTDEASIVDEVPCGMCSRCSCEALWSCFFTLW